MGNMRSVGAAGEDEAVAYLEQLGYQVLHRNYHCRVGELDAVVRSPEGHVVFVEVKWRAHDWDGGGIAAVDAKKLQRMRIAAAHWMVEHSELTSGAPALRFDVIDVGPDGVRDHVQGVW
ncbi:YraN family protein [uncultured Corynebacterium sp.]|uniref:YraN family protein n=1 Tax=uncultured Corynebacterium sp. TaxID=159447 RepID=UPI0025F8988C|nr:YraN family protein [uncultured Corynebacterium sp.]